MTLVVVYGGIISGILGAVCAIYAGSGALGTALAYSLGGVLGVIVLLTLCLLREARTPCVPPRQVVTR
ncbi:hypothetical protein GEU84_011120 [Fertoebacter nigrum]|uniref:Uncharacterized protein n=1 Tax=Fertoeibacter niger TaxID=2656921 RepID=A0A8X8GZV6_9RHOB|nr:hypothetical protein [Fertoeibacter niger]NUB44938.1 hypothetical protein [Fertoeibacter niger]